jgi:MraZ protein
MDRFVSAEAVVVVGLGHKFQIWEPQRLGAHLAKATARVRTLTRRFGPQCAASDEGARE